MCDWTPISARMPPEGMTVDALTPDGRRARVKWEGRLWKLPGGAHCPCFAPEYWRPASGRGMRRPDSPPRQPAPHLQSTFQT